MSLSPEQIAAKRFVVALRGYDRDEVDTFLKEVADDVAGLLGQPPGDRPPAEGPTAGLARFAEQIDTLIRSAAGVADDIRARAEEEALQVLETAERQAAEHRDQAAAAIANERSEWEAEWDQQNQALAQARAEVEAELAQAEQLRQAAEEMHQDVERHAAAMRESLEEKSARLKEQDAHSAELQTAAGQRLAEATAIREAAEREASSILARTREEAAALHQQVRERLQQSIDALSAISVSVQGSAEASDATSGESAAMGTIEEAGG